MNLRLENENVVYRNEVPNLLSKNGESFLSTQIAVPVDLLALYLFALEKSPYGMVKIESTPEVALKLRSIAVYFLQEEASLTDEQDYSVITAVRTKMKKMK